MVETTRKDTGNEVGDAARSKVPLSHRLGFWNNCFVLWGWVLVLSSFLVGGMVGTEFPLKMAMPIIVFGTLCNAIIGGLISPCDFPSPTLGRDPFSWADVGAFSSN